MYKISNDKESYALRESLKKRAALMDLDLTQFDPGHS